MAIKYLSKILATAALDLNKTELQNAVIQNLASAPSAPAEGQIYYDSSAGDKSIYFWDGTTWVDVGGDIRRVIAGAGLTQSGTRDVTINVGQGTGIKVNADDVQLFHLGLQDLVDPNADRIFFWDDSAAASAWLTASTASGINISGTTLQLGAIPNSSLTNSSLTITAGVGLSGGGSVALGASATLTLDLTELTVSTQTIVPAADYIVGLFNSGTVQGKRIVSDFTLNSWSAPTGDVSIGTHKLVAVQDPTAAQDAATKNYVDTTLAGSGALIYQGGYDASVAPPSAGVLQGWTYAVTVAGDGAGFFTTTLEVGDLIISNVNTPTTEADWTEINKNIDVATDTIQGIANFPTAGGLSVAAGAVSLTTLGGGAGSVGSASESLSITTDIKGRVTARTAQSIAITASQVTDFTAAVNAIIDGDGAAVDVGDGSSTTYVITHNLATRDLVIQLYDNATYDTVYCDTARTTINTATLVFATAPTANQFRALLKIVS